VTRLKLSGGHSGSPPFDQEDGWPAGLVAPLLVALRGDNGVVTTPPGAGVAAATAAPPPCPPGGGNTDDSMLRLSKRSLRDHARTPPVRLVLAAYRATKNRFSHLESQGLVDEEYRGA
jgi:hypothetical protein